MNSSTCTTSQCLELLLKDTKDSQAVVLDKIAAFTGTSARGVRHWFDGVRKPPGEQLIRLRFYLEFIGYKVEELESLAPQVRDVARLFAFRLVSISEIAELVGYVAGRNGIDTVICIFRGSQGISERRIRDFESIMELYGERLAEKQNATPKIIFDRSPGSHVEKSKNFPSQAIPPLRIRAQKPLQQHEAIIESIAGSIKAMIPLARLVNSDEFTAEERVQVRKLADGDGVFVLMNLLSCLCGERARETNLNNQQPATRKEFGNG